MRILVVCGAGASSTFVAQRLRRAANDAGLDWFTEAGTEHTVEQAFADLVLVGPHLADRVDTIRAITDARVTVLPDDIFADRDGARVLALAQLTLADGSPSPSNNPSPAKGTS